MRVLASVESLFESGPSAKDLSAGLAYVTSDVYQELVQAYPEGGKSIRGGVGRYFECRLLHEDSRLRAVLDVLSKHGYRLKKRMAIDVAPLEFSFRLEREYEEIDIKTAAFLVCGSTVGFVDFSYRAFDTGSVVFPVGRICSNLDFGYAFPWIVVSDKARKILEGEALTGATFNPVQQALKDERGPFRLIEGLWELSTALTLPPMSKSCIFMNNDGDVFDGDYSKGCHLVEGNYSFAEVHYENSALKDFGDFDIAYSRETVGNAPTVLYPYRIISRRFYEVCKGHGFKVTGIPVRLDS